MQKLSVVIVTGRDGQMKVLAGPSMTEVNVVHVEPSYNGGDIVSSGPCAGFYHKTLQACDWLGAPASQELLDELKVPNIEPPMPESAGGLGCGVPGYRNIALPAHVAPAVNKLVEIRDDLLDDMRYIMMSYYGDDDNEEYEDFVCRKDRSGDVPGDIVDCPDARINGHEFCDIITTALTAIVQAQFDSWAYDRGAAGTITIDLLENRWTIDHDENVLETQSQVQSGLFARTPEL